jgi:hypothetical protein
VTRELQRVCDKLLGNSKRRIADEITVARLDSQEIADFAAGKSAIDDVPAKNFDGA